MAIDLRAKDNDRIETIIESMRVHFDKKMDVVMRVFESSNAELYSLYKSARAIDINGSVTPATVEVEVAPNTILNIYRAEPYDANRFFTCQNLSDSDAVSLSLSTSATTEGALPVTIPAGDTRQRLASNLASSGIFVNINNVSNAAVRMKLWVE